MKSGKCRLCGNVKLLLNKSHIIPDSLYKYVFNLDHSLIKFESHKKNPYIPNYTRHYNGEFEGGILCQNCDNVILGQNLEDYGSKIFVEKILNPNFRSKKNQENEVNFDTLSKIDYQKFKVYLLSILWRMSICNRSFFKGVELGVHEFKLRKMILNEDPGRVEEYPFILFDCNDKELNLNGCIAAPVRLLQDSIVSYSVLIGGIIIIFKLTENEKTPSVLKHTLKPNGEMDIARLDNDLRMGFLENHFQFSQLKDKQ
jgi:hypothetical protein